MLCYRPASTDKVDEDALLIGIPAGSFSPDAAPRDDSYFFVVLRAPQEVFWRQPPSPIDGLKLGAQLGAGMCYLTACLRKSIAPAKCFLILRAWLRAH